MFDSTAPTMDPERYSLFFAIMTDRETTIRLGWHHSHIRRVHGLTKPERPPELRHLSVLGVDGGFGAPGQEILAPALHAASRLRYPQFGMEFRSFESFSSPKKDKPLVATETSRNEPLFAFQHLLREAVRGAGVRLPQQSFSRPHVTLAYDQPIPAPLGIRPISMIVREFVLVLSHHGQSRYDFLGRWRLIPW